MPNWSQGGQGAVGGALSGASMGGTIGGPYGAAIGGVAGGLIGGIGGLFGSDESEQQKANRERLEAYYNQLQGRTAPQMGPAAQGSYSNFRGNQSELISRLEALSKGQGPSLAMEQMRAGMDRTQSQQASMANSGRGGPLAAQQAANNMALLGARGTQDAAAARIQEQQMALNQLGLTLHGARGADEQMNQFNANEQNQQAQSNLEARLRTMGMNDQAIAQVLSQMNGNTNLQAQQPGLGSQILAGGAGMFSQYATSRAGQQQKQATPSMPNYYPGNPVAGAFGR